MASLVAQLIKNLPITTGDPSSISWMGRSPGGWIGYPLQYSLASLVAQIVKNPYNAGYLGLIPGLGRYPGEGMATHSSIRAWRIPWTEEPGRLQSIEWQRVKHNLATFTLGEYLWNQDPSKEPNQTRYWPKTKKI